MKPLDRPKPLDYAAPEPHGERRTWRFWVYVYFAVGIGALLIDWLAVACSRP